MEYYRSALVALLIVGCSEVAEPDSVDSEVSPVTADGVDVRNLKITPGATTARASYTLSSQRALRFSEIVVAVRDAAGKNFDFGRRSNVSFIGRQMFSSKSGTLPNGTYSAWIAYTLDGTRWVDIDEKKTFTIGPVADAGATPPVPLPEAGTVLPPAPPGKSLVFNAPFSDTTRWTVGRTSSYPGSTNPNDNKLDYISPMNAPAADGTFHATKRADGKWDADLVTTEYASNAFELKPNDELDATVTLGPELGAWPAIWTWGRDLPMGVQPGHGEVDLFEYHPDNANLLELSNHTQNTSKYFTDAANIKPNVPFELRVVFGSASVDWYVNGTLAYADGKGVPSNWTAYPIVNISVCAGQYHPAPNGTSMSYRVENFRVYR
jgi:hypothetical protein